MYHLLISSIWSGRYWQVYIMAFNHRCLSLTGADTGFRKEMFLVICSLAVYIFPDVDGVSDLCPLCTI